MAEAAATSVAKEDLGKKLERALKAENNWKPLHHSRPMVDVARMVVNWTEGMQC